jgi:hypothetical protein
MQKKTKIAAGSAAAVAALIAGGFAIAIPAQAATNAPSSSVVETEDPADTDDVQNEVEDGTADGEAEDSTEAEDSAEESGAEDTSDDINGVAVEDGHQD